MKTRPPSSTGGRGYRRKDTSPRIYVRYAMWKLLCRHADLRDLLSMDGGARYTFPYMRRDLPGLLEKYTFGSDPIYAFIIMRDFRARDGALQWDLLRRHARSAATHVKNPSAKTRRPHRPQDWDRYMQWARLRFSVAGHTIDSPAVPGTSPDLHDTDAFFSTDPAAHDPDDIDLPAQPAEPTAAS